MEITIEMIIYITCNKKCCNVITITIHMFSCKMLWCNNYQSSFEGDSEIAINSLWSNGMANSFVGHIIKDTMSYVSLSQSFSFSHVGGQGNAIAHALA